MTTPGEFRRQAQRIARAARQKPPQELTPIELAIARKLATHAKQEAPPERDARAIAGIVVKHWGDQAPAVAELTLEYVRDEVGRWTPATPETAERGPSTPAEGEG